MHAFQALMQAILRHVNFDVAKCVLLASPGFTKDQVIFNNSIEI